MKVNINGISLEISTAKTSELEELIKYIDKILISINSKLDNDILADNKRNELLLKKIKLEKVKNSCIERIEKRRFKNRVGARKKSKKSKNCSIITKTGSNNKVIKMSSSSYEDCYTNKSVKAISNAVGSKR